MHRFSWLSALLSLALLAGCLTPQQSVFPRLGPLTDQELVATLHSRTHTARSFYALIEIVYEGPERSGSFDAIVHWRGPHEMRVSAYKDVVLTAQGVFDLLFTASDYAFEIAEEEGGQIARGPLSEFAQEHERFAGFLWAGEALFLAGALGDPQEARVSRDGAELHVEARLARGTPVVWQVEPETLEVRSAVVRGTREVQLSYGAYQRVEGLYLPGKVTFSDPVAETRLEFELRELELNPELDEAVFDPATVGPPQ